MKINSNTIGLLLALVVALLGAAGFAYGVKADVAEAEASIAQLELKMEFSKEVTAALNRESLKMLRELSDSDDEAEGRFDEIEKKIAVLEATGR